MGNSGRRFFAPEQVGPFLKWAGGKGQLLEQYRRYLPSSLQGRRYVEPFVGSGAVFFYVRQNLCPQDCTLLDINPELINAYQQLRDNVEEVLDCLTVHRDHHNTPGISEQERKVYYYQVRALDEDLSLLSPGERAARFIYLNKTCFNGLHRLNSQGRFNVPMGSYRAPAIFDTERLRRVSALLRGVTIEICPFQECERFIGEGDFVYFDPPYEPLSRTSSFTGYAKEDFSQQNQRELCEMLDRLRGHCDWMLSNSASPLILELYGDPQFYKYRVLAARAINSKPEGRGHIEEMVITSYEVPPLVPEKG